MAQLYNIRIRKKKMPSAFVCRFFGLHLHLPPLASLPLHLNKDTRESCYILPSHQPPPPSFMCFVGSWILHKHSLSFISAMSHCSAAAHFPPSGTFAALTFLLVLIHLLNVRVHISSCASQEHHVSLCCCLPHLTLIRFEYIRSLRTVLKFFVVLFEIVVIKWLGFCF